MRGCGGRAMNVCRGQSGSPNRVEGNKIEDWVDFVLCPRQEHHPVDAKSCLNCEAQSRCRAWRIECPDDGRWVTQNECAGCVLLQGCRNRSIEEAEGIQTATGIMVKTQRRKASCLGYVEHSDRYLHWERAWEFLPKSERKRKLDKVEEEEESKKKKTRSKWTRSS